MQENINTLLKILERTQEDAPPEATLALKTSKLQIGDWSVNYSLTKERTKLVSIMNSDDSVTIQFSEANTFLWSNKNIWDKMVNDLVRSL